MDAIEQQAAYQLEATALAWEKSEAYRSCDTNAIWDVEERIRKFRERARADGFSVRIVQKRVRGDSDGILYRLIGIVVPRDEPQR
ncbi:MAG: hypothetical protein ABI876_16705 [Bacteroidota bacterium]